MKILLLNPGRRDYLVKYFLDLSNKFNLKIFILDSDKNIPSFKISKKTKNFTCPKANKKNYLYFLKKFVRINKINVIFPLSEHEMLKLAKEKKIFEKSGINTVISDLKVVNLCKNKLKTYDFLKKNKIMFPKIVKFKELKKNLPVIRKEVKGNSSRNQMIINSIDQIPKIENKKFFFQKHIKSEEYGMDILNDLNGNFIHFCVKKKYQIRAGDTDKAKIVNPKKFFQLAYKISSSLKHIGNLDIDFMYRNKKTYVLDFNPRFGGGYPFTHEYGYNYIERILEILKTRKKFKKFKSFENKNNLFSKGITVYKH